MSSCRRFVLKTPNLALTAWYFPCERIQASFGRLRTLTKFSLIELLVVVAIIGILGGVGIVGYQAYISQTQDATTKDNFEFLKRTLDQDIVSVSNELAARSKFSEGLTKASFDCTGERDGLR